MFDDEKLRSLEAELAEVEAKLDAMLPLVQPLVGTTPPKAIDISAQWSRDHEALQRRKTELEKAITARRRILGLPE